MITRLSTAVKTTTPARWRTPTPSTIGRAAGKGNYAVVERYTPARRRWERVSKLGKPRGRIAAATVAGRIVVVGGGLSHSRSVTSLRIR